MSLRAIVWAFEQHCPSPTAKLVLVKLADHVNGKTGECFPSQSMIAKDCGLSRETVNRQIKSLVAAGIVSMEAHSDEHGRQANRYFLRCDFASQACDRTSHPPVIVDHTPCDPPSQEPGIEPGSLTSPPIVPPTGGRAHKLEFEDWWQVVPRKVGKDAAERKYRVARRQASAETLIAAMRSYASSCPPDKQFVAHPATWLHQGRWKDEDLSSATEGSAGPTGPPPKPEDLWPDLRRAG